MVILGKGNDLQLSTTSAELSEKSEAESREEGQDSGGEESEQCESDVNQSDSDVVEIASESEPDEPMMAGKE